MNTSHSPKENGTPISASRRLGAIALSIWIISLFLPGLILTYGDDVSGYQILFSGWLGIFFLILPWYANPFYLYASWKLIFSEEVPLRAAVMALSVGTTVFLYQRFPVGSAAGEDRELYGLGWGAFLWYSALLLAVLASYAREMEIKGSCTGYKSIWRMHRGKTVIVGLIFWFCLALAGLGQWAISNGTEKDQLAKVIIRPGKVCTEKDFKISSSIPLQGALEVVSDGRWSSMTHPGILINWGVPVVRKGRFDYYASGHSTESHLVAGPPRTAVSAVLYGSGGSGNINARLTSPDDKIIAFDVHWRSDPDKTKHYCPGYYSDPRPDQPPRSLLVSALGLNVSSHAQIKHGDWLFYKQKSEAMDVKSVTVVRNINRSEYKGNMGCDPDVGIRHNAKWTNADENEKYFIAPSAWGLTGRQPAGDLYAELLGVGNKVVQLRDHFHFIKGLARYPKAVCSQKYMYLSQGGRISTQGTAYLEIQKRSLEDFHKEWPLNKSIKFAPPAELGANKDSGFSIFSAREDGDELIIGLALFDKYKEEGRLVEIVTSQ